MIRKLGSVAAIALLSSLGVAEAQVACESLKGFQAPDVKITNATSATSPVPLCKVDGVIGKEINFSVWLPDAWNGKFVMGGQGGFAGRVESQATSDERPAEGLRRRPARTRATPRTGRGIDGAWAAGDVERLVNYAHGGIHRTTAVTKTIVNARYGRAPERSYFAGCSNGGRRGAAVGAALSRTISTASSPARPRSTSRASPARSRTSRSKMYPDPEEDRHARASTRPAREIVAKAVKEKCDALDGLSDGIFGDPRQCTFDVKTIQCKIGQEGQLPDAGAGRRCRGHRQIARCRTASRSMFPIRGAANRPKPTGASG